MQKKVPPLVVSRKIKKSGNINRRILS